MKALLPVHLYTPPTSIRCSVVRALSRSRADRGRRRGAATGRSGSVYAAWRIPLVQRQQIHHHGRRRHVVVTNDDAVARRLRSLTTQQAAGGSGSRRGRLLAIGSRSQARSVSRGTGSSTGSSESSGRPRAWASTVPESRAVSRQPWAVSTSGCSRSCSATHWGPARAVIDKAAKAGISAGRCSIPHRQPPFRDQCRATLRVVMTRRARHSLPCSVGITPDQRTRVKRVSIG